MEMQPPRRSLHHGGTSGGPRRPRGAVGGSSPFGAHGADVHGTAVSRIAHGADRGPTPSGGDADIAKALRLLAENQQQLIRMMKN